MEKKICFHLNCLARGGAERVVTNLSERFAKEGFEVIIATEWQDEDEYAISDAIRRVHVGLRPEDEKKNRIVQFFLRIKYLREFVKKEKPAVLIAFAKKANYRALMATLGTKQKTVICVRTDPTGHYDLKSDKVLIPLLYPHAAGFVFQTTGQRDFFPAYVGKKSRIILNALNEKYLNIAPVSQRRKEVVHSGRLKDFKNHLLLVEAFVKVHDRHPEYVLNCYGADAGDGTWQLVEASIARHNAGDYITLCGGCDNLEEVLPGASVYAFSSDWEGLPNAVIEAMAMGLPVVATDCPCGGPATVIQNGENGLLVPIKDADALAEGICYMIEHPEDAERMGQNARKITEITNSEAVFRQWWDYLQTL